MAKKKERTVVERASQDALFGEGTHLWEQAWQGMPEFVSENQKSLHKVIVHFASWDDWVKFRALVDQPAMTRDTKSIWYPREDSMDLSTKLYVDAEDDGG